MAREPLCCALCADAAAAWAWQPWSAGTSKPPEGYFLRFRPLGAHVPGVPVVKVCAGCKELIESGARVIAVRYGGKTYLWGPFPLETADLGEEATTEARP